MSKGREAKRHDYIRAPNLCYLNYLDLYIYPDKTVGLNWLQLPIVFRLSSPLPTQCKAAVTTVGSEKPSTFFTVRSTHGLSSSTSRLGRDILQPCRSQKLDDLLLLPFHADGADCHVTMDQNKITWHQSCFHQYKT